MIVAVVIAAAAMTIDWLAVERELPRIERVVKPLAMVGLILVVLTADDVGRGAGGAVVVALVFALVGDVLLLPEVDRFIEGLAAFVGTHIAYLTAFVIAGVDPVLLVLGAAAATVATTWIGRPIVAGAARTNPRLGRAVVLYVVVLSAMWTGGFGVGDIVAIAGSTLFVSSDAVLGWNRFVGALPRGRLLTHVPYHVGQALIVAWVVTN